jgi:hypothetical protein
MELYLRQELKGSNSKLQEAWIESLIMQGHMDWHRI